ncbi:MAG: signal peptide peptidase SppA [Pirellulaceae bacterium]|nr:signal peptide peptidase SppA [Pirellulaceae bacterium]
MASTSDPTPESTPELPASQPAVPTVIVQAGPAGRFTRFVSMLGWLGFLLCGLSLMSHFSAKTDYFDTSEGIKEHFHSRSKDATDKIAIITLSGVIMEGDGFVKRQIDRIRTDDHVRAVVLRINTPGGTVTGSDYILHHLIKLRDEKKIPLVVSMGSMATSGGYYIAMAVGDEEQTIFAEPTTTTGSIGVIIPHYDVSGFLDRWNIKDDSIASHERKQMLSMTRELNPEHREIIQRYVDESFLRFKNIVKQGRAVFRDGTDNIIDPNTGTDLATGEMFSAQQALGYQLVDRIGFLDEAIDRAIELAKLPSTGKVRVIHYQQPTSLLSIAGLAQESTPGSRLQALLELSVPRAYYLNTTIPPLITATGGMGSRDR